MRSLKWMWVAWPAFLVAGLLEMLVFALVDPEDMHWFGHAFPLSRQGIYTVSFFVFWLFAMVSSGLTVLLAVPPAEVNEDQPR